MIDKRLMNLVPKAKKHIFKAVLYKWIGLISNIVIVVTISKILEILYRKDFDRIDYKYYGILFFAIGIRYIFTIRAQRECFNSSTEVKITLRHKILKKLFNIGYNYRKVLNTSSLTQSAVEGVEQLESYFSQYLPQFFYALLAPLTLFIFISFINIKTAFVLFIVVPFIPISIVIVQKIAKKLLSKYWNNYTELGDSFLENIQGLTTLKIYQTDNYRHQKMNEESENFRKTTMKVLVMQLNSITIMDIFAYGGAALGIVIALNQMNINLISLSEAIIIILLSADFFIPLRQLGSFFHIAQNGIAASNQIFEILDFEENNIGEKEIGNNYDITLDKISFSYNDNKEIIKNVSMKFKENSFTSIVGISGCGKSTIASIISGVNKIDKGKAQIGDLLINEIKQESISKNICIIGAESYIFAGTLRENLLIGNKKASDFEMYSVLKKMRLTDFLVSKKGLDTIILERGSNLSGGQKQRIALARAILHNPSIYIFDESTNSIDIESETVILNQIKELSSNKTIIMISHRLANCIFSDNIYVLRNGQIVEEGSHEKLLINNNLYSSLWKKQQDLELSIGGNDGE